MQTAPCLKHKTANVEGTPDIQDFVSIIAKIHNNSAGKSPTGKFGFGVTTHLGYISNDNSWQDSWEVWFKNAMKRIFEEEERSHGEDDTQGELDTLKDALYDKVIPRLLPPLESNGRKIVPCLIHSGLWLGNIMMDANTDELVIFDSCAYWGHNESDLGVWTAPRYRLGQPYLTGYQKQMGQSAPKEDWDDRNALYAMCHFDRVTCPQLAEDEVVLLSAANTSKIRPVVRCSARSRSIFAFRSFLTIFSYGS